MEKECCRENAVDITNVQEFDAKYYCPICGHSWTVKSTRPHPTRVIEQPDDKNIGA